MSTIRLPLFFTFSCLFASLVSSAEDVDATGKELETPVRIIVQVKSAPIMAGDKKVFEAPLGALLEYNRVKGNWFFVPQMKGWLHQKDVIEQKGAVEHFTKMIKDKPTAEALHLRGIAYMAQDDWGKGLLDLEKAYDQGEGSVSLHFNLGTCYRQLEDYPAALKEFTEILKTYPDEFPAIMARGSILSEQGHWEAALKDFDAALKLDSKSTPARNFRGVALRMLGKFEEAEAEYTTALELQPDFAEAMANRAYVRKGMGKFEEALADYQESLKLSPDADGVQNDFAWFLATCPEESLRDPKQAVKIAEQVCQKTENSNGEYLDTLAAAYASAGDFKQAEKTAQQALELLKDNPGSKSVFDRIELYRSEKAFVENLEK